MCAENSRDEDLPFTLYRLQVVSAMPTSPYKDSLLKAIRERLEKERLEADKSVIGEGGQPHTEHETVARPT